MTAPTAPTGVSVVVVTYDDPRRLGWVLDALATQHADLDEVVVADDGSPRPPDPGPRPFPVRVVRQEDLGFRAAAARNLGAAATSPDAQVLVFLDGDTVPGPRYVAALAAACRSAGERATGRAAGRGLAVGRRRHADLAGLDDAGVAGFVAGHGSSAPQRVLAEPRWLADGYGASGDLRQADGRSYRFVISAVLAVTRPL